MCCSVKMDRSEWNLMCDNKSMVLCKKNVTLLLKHQRYVFCMNLLKYMYIGNKHENGCCVSYNFLQFNMSMKSLACHIHLTWSSTLHIYFSNALLTHTDGLVQDCSNSIANVLELLQPYTKPSISTVYKYVTHSYLSYTHKLHSYLPSNLLI